jgi:hypothetical protein
VACTIDGIPRRGENAMKKTTPERCGIMVRTATSCVTAHVASTARRCTARQPLPVISSAGARELSARIVDQGVDAAEALERLVDHRPNLAVLPNVDGHGQRASADPLDFGGRLLQRLRPSTSDDDIGAAAGQIQRDGASDTGSAAGHQRGRAAVDTAVRHLTGATFRILDLHRTDALSTI